MRKFLSLFAALILAMGSQFVPVRAHAQSASVATACSAQNLPTGYLNGTLIVKQNGDLCVAGGGGGGGGAVTIADCADVALGCIADPTVLSGASGTAESYLRTLKDVALSTAPSPVKIDQTTPGTTNGVSPVAAATGGATAYGLQSAASTNSTNVKNAAGVLYGMNLINTTTTIYYLRMYDSASAPTCSSATNFSRTWPVPPGVSSGQAGGVAAKLPEMGVQFSAGISFCLTGGPTSTDNTSAATGVFINLDYK